MIKKFALALFILSIITVTPIASVNTAYAAGIVPDCGLSTPKLDKNGSAVDEKGKEYGTTIANPCNFDHLMALINNLIDFLLKYLATPLAALAICFAGGLLIFSGGSPESRTKAKKIIKSVIIGYIIALAAWLIVKTILSTLGFDPKDAYLVGYNYVLLFNV